MTNEQRYWEFVETLIRQANEELDHQSPGEVVSAMVSATSRFCAFYAASSSESRKDLEEDKNEVVHQFGGEFKRKLADDLDDYVANYKVLVLKDQS